VVPLAGLEPARCFHHLILSQARLPIPPQGHFCGASGADNSRARERVNAARRPIAGARRRLDWAKYADFKEIAMNEEVLNTSLRKFLKTVGVTSQREIEKAIRAAVASGRIKGNEALKAKMVLTVGEVGLNHEVDGVIELD
jgi:Family of unknown function (DUF6494)